MNKTKYQTCFHKTIPFLILLASDGQGLKKPVGFHKTIPFLILLGLALTLIMPGSTGQVLAGPAVPQIQVESINGNDGSIIPVRVSLLNPGEILGGSFILHYDSECLEPVIDNGEIKAESGSLFASALAAQAGAGTINIAVAGAAMASGADTDNPIDFCLVYFKLIKAGQSALSITDVELSDGYNTIDIAETVSATVTVNEVPVNVTAGSSQSIYPNSTPTRPVNISWAGQVTADPLTVPQLPATTLTLQIISAADSAFIAAIDNLPLDAEGRFASEWTMPATVGAGEYILQAEYNRKIYKNLAAFSVIMLPPPAADPAPQQFTDTLQVSLSCVDGAVIYYTLDSQVDPAADVPGASLYSEPILLDATATIRAVAVKDGVSSEIVAYTYTLINDECFIATAAYGSKFTPAVTLLRDFRDHYLLTNAPGQALVAFYYRHSPPLAQYIAKRPMCRAVVRGVLTPVVVGVYILYHPAAATVTVSLLIIASIWLFRRRRPIQQVK